MKIAARRYTTAHGATRQWFDGGGPLWNHRTCDNGFLTTQSLDVHSNRRLVIYGGTCQYVTSRKRHARCDQMRFILTTLHTVYSAHSISLKRLSVWYVAAALKTKSTPSDSSTTQAETRVIRCFEYKNIQYITGTYVWERLTDVS